MAVSYKKLWKLLIDKDIKKKDLSSMAGVSPATITKMGKEGTVVTTDVLVKICVALNCEIESRKLCRNRPVWSLLSLNLSLLSLKTA